MVLLSVRETLITRTSNDYNSCPSTCSFGCHCKRPFFTLYFAVKMYVYLQHTKKHGENRVFSCHLHSHGRPLPHWSARMSPFGLELHNTNPRIHWKEKGGWRGQRLPNRAIKQMYNSYSYAIHTLSLSPRRSYTASYTLEYHCKRDTMPQWTPSINLSPTQNTHYNNWMDLSETGSISWS